MKAAIGLMFRSVGLGALAVLGSVLAGCYTPGVYVDRETVESWSDEEIVANNIDLTSLKKRKKSSVGVYVTVSDQSQGANREVMPQAFLNDAQGLAENYLSRVKAYRVKPLDSHKFNRDGLLTGDDVALKEFEFLIDMKIALNSEMYSKDDRRYRVSIDWKLIDNRTKKNGLGNSDAPFVLEALTCQHEINRKSCGSVNSNSQSIYRTALENALMVFRAQLANRLTFGGRILRMRLRDDKVRFMLDAGMGVGGDGKGGDGIVKRMQMLVVNEDGDSVCVAQVMNGREGKTMLEAWRWLSDELEDEVYKKAKNAKKRPSEADEDDEDEDEESFYAVSLGMPTPDRDERTKMGDRE